jgi:hypothetical protein
MTIIANVDRSTGLREFWLGFAAYLLPTFPIAFVWHLVLFGEKYKALHIYRDEPVIALGLFSMVIQGVIFSWLFPRVFPQREGSILRDGLLYGLGIGLLSWSFTTIAVAAKNAMVSVQDFLMLETAFTLIQFAIVGPLIALAYRR